MAAAMVSAGVGGHASSTHGSPALQPAWDSACRQIDSTSRMFRPSEGGPVSISSTMAELLGELGFDPDALREKYREERDKRLRGDGNEQYVEVTGDFAHYVDDPYVEPGFTREPLTDEVDVAVDRRRLRRTARPARGCARRASRTSASSRRRGDFGGTWYWNRYPGAQCDVESYIYLPLLEELGYIPKREVLRGARDPRAQPRASPSTSTSTATRCFQTEVTEMRWDEDATRWIISTNRGDRMRARFVCMANGPLNRPKLPGIPGIETFEGHTFHTSRWDYGYTGGDSTGT